MTRTLLVGCLICALLGTLAAVGAVIVHIPYEQREVRAGQLIDEAQRLAARGELVGARAAIQAALATDPENVRAHRELALRLLAEGSRQEALSELRFVARKASGDAGAAWELAVALRASGDARGAAEWFRRVARLSPRNALASSFRAECLLQLGETTEALGEAEHGARFLPRSPQAWRVLGAARWKSGDFAGAQEALESSWRLRPSDVNALWALATLAGARRQPETVVQYLQLAVRTKPDEPALWAELGGALAALGRQSEAERAFAEARRVGRDSPEVRARISQLRDRAQKARQTGVQP